MEEEAEGFGALVAIANFGVATRTPSLRVKSLRFHCRASMEKEFSEKY